MKTTRILTTVIFIGTFQTVWFQSKKSKVCLGTIGPKTVGAKRIQRKPYRLDMGRDDVIGLQLATGWTVRGSNPGGGQTFCTDTNMPWGSPRLLYNGYRVIPGGKVAGAWH